MIVKKCDICGAEMRITTPRYKVTFDGWLYTKEKDICIDCFKRIVDEIKQADTPQTDCVGCEDSMDVWAETRPGVFERISVCGLDDCEQTDCPWK